MADLQTLVDHIHYESRREYTHVEGDIAYLDGAPLKRPFTLPRAQRITLFIVVIIAAVISFVFVNNTVLQAMRESALAEQTVISNLTREASIETIPNMAQLALMSDDDIRNSFQEAGYIVYDASDTSNPNSMLLYKLPADLPIEEAAALYAKGVSNLTSSQASKLLNGSWMLSSDRNGGTSMVVRYCDFSTGDPARAVQNALAKEGFNPESITESGEDDSGNTYSMGALDNEGVHCVWKISALPLDDMYSVKGLPEDACYVGVRVTVQ